MIEQHVSHSESGFCFLATTPVLRASLAPLCVAHLSQGNRVTTYRASQWPEPWLTLSLCVCVCVECLWECMCVWWVGVCERWVCVCVWGGVWYMMCDVCVVSGCVYVCDGVCGECMWGVYVMGVVCMYVCEGCVCVVCVCMWWVCVCVDWCVCLCDGWVVCGDCMCGVSLCVYVCVHVICVWCEECKALRLQFLQSCSRLAASCPEPQQSSSFLLLFLASLPPLLVLHLLLEQLHEAAVVGEGVGRFRRPVRGLLPPEPPLLLLLLEDCWWWWRRCLFWFMLLFLHLYCRCETIIIQSLHSLERCFDLAG